MSDREQRKERLRRQLWLLDQKDSWGPNDYATAREINRQLRELAKETADADQ